MTECCSATIVVLSTSVRLVSRHLQCESGECVFVEDLSTVMAWNYPPNPPYYDYYTAGFPTVVHMGIEVDTSATQSLSPTQPHLLVLIQIVDANIPTA